jgi:hypothetical protein
VVSIVEGPYNFEGCENAEDPVELAAGYLGIKVRPHQHGRCAGATPLAPREDVPHGIDSNSTRSIFAPPDEQIAGRSIGLSQREAVATAGRSGADLGHLH